jgi:hypothetical protein
MIYGRFGDPVTLVRMGTLADVKLLDRRKPDAQDKKSVANKCYVVTRHEDGSELLHHIGYLRADEGIKEIEAAIIAIGGGPN